MYFDIISCKKTNKVEEVAKRLHLKVFSLEELKSLRIVEGKNDEIIRRTIEHKQADILLDPHQQREKDYMHYKNSGLNHILCELARKNNITIALSLEKCYETKDLGKIMQNIALCRKYKTPLIFLSLAKDEYGLRNPNDLISLGKLLGMTPGDATKALTSLGDILKRKNIKY